MSDEDQGRDVGQTGPVNADAAIPNGDSRRHVYWLFAVLTLAMTALAFVLAAANATAADTYAPRKGQVFTGIVGNTGLSRFESMTGSQPAILQHFVSLSEWHG